MTPPCRPVLIGLLFSLLLAGCSSLQIPDTPWSGGEGYFSYYGLDSLSGERACGYSGYGEQSLWTWSVSPSRPRGTVVFLHGYLDHSALSLALFAFLNDRGYRIVAYDLPGHGLSGGQRAGLEDFDQYGESLDRIMAYWDLAYGDTLFIGHSTGGAVILDRLLKGQNMGGVILAAPLIQFRHFDGALFLAEHLFRGRGTVRVSRKPSSRNDEFNKKKRNDPLAIKRMPLNWPLAIGAWEKELPRGEIPCDVPILVLQGGKDRVVFFERNIPRIESWFPRARIRTFPGLMHHLFNEADGEKLYGEIQAFLL